MGFKKKEATATVAPPAKLESGTNAAINRLKSAKSAEKKPKPKFKQNDPDEVARGKTRCQTFCAAVTSPAIAGMPFDSKEQFVELVKFVADQGVKYSFQD